MLLGSLREPDFEGMDDLFGDVVLHRENVGNLAVVAFGPEDDRLVSPSINCAVTLIRCPDLRTLPSRT